MALTYGLQAVARGNTLGESPQKATLLGAEFVFWAWLYALLAAGARGLSVRDAIRFNALHGVTALVEEDPARASEALERLGDLLHYAIDDADRTTVDFCGRRSASRGRTSTWRSS